MSELLYQYCPKLVVFSQDQNSVFLCKRLGEQDYDGTYSFIGGKMEHSDVDILGAIKREKNEEVGEGFLVRVCLKYSIDIHFEKKNGSKMIIPHFLALHQGGEPNLNDEYSDFAWVPVGQLEGFEPKISNISWISQDLLKLAPLLSAVDFADA